MGIYGGMQLGAVHRLVLALGAALGLLACSTSPGTPSAPRATAREDHAWVSTALGMGEEYLDEARSLAQAREDLARIHKTGATVLRVAMRWDEMEPAHGEYDWSFWDDFVRSAVDDYGLQLLPYVASTPTWAASIPGADAGRSPPFSPYDYGRFMTVVAARYARWIHHWEIWNEPDNPAYWSGNVADFAELVISGSRGIKRGHAGATVVLGGLAGDLDFLRVLLAEHGIAPAIDVINIRSSFETWHSNGQESLTEYVAAAAALVRELGENEPLWMAGTGYRAPAQTAWKREEPTAEAQASALARTVLLSLATERLALLAWPRLNNLPATRDVNGRGSPLQLGPFNPSGDAQPALVTFEWLVRHLSQPYRVISVKAAGMPAQPVASVAFALADGRRLVAAWLPTRAGTLDDGEPITDERAASVELTLGEPIRRVGEILYAPGRPPRPQSVTLLPTRPAQRLHVQLHGGEVTLVVLE